LDYEVDVTGVAESSWPKSAMSGLFNSWYILQHYKGYNKKYKPYNTYVEFEVVFECVL